MSFGVGEVMERLEIDLCSFSNLSVTSPTSQLIFQPFRRFTYVTVHSPTLPLLYLHNSSFSDTSFASPTSQALQLRHLASPPCCGWRITSLLLTRFDPRSCQFSLVEGFSRSFSLPYDKSQENVGSTHPRISLAIIIIKNHSLRASMTSDVDAPQNLIYRLLFYL